MKGTMPSPTLCAPMGLELPPGASFDPDPQNEGRSVNNPFK